MRTITGKMLSAFNQKTARPVLIAEMIFSVGQKVYVTSSAVSGLSGSNVFTGFKTFMSGTTVEITPEDAHSTIGSMKFGVLDLNAAFSTKIATLDAAGLGMRDVRVNFYFGCPEMVWADYTVNDIVASQLVDDCEIDNDEFIITCRDIQRSSRTKIFRLAKTILSFNVGKDDLLIPIASATGSQLSNSTFEKMFHGPTFTDAPGATVGYVKIDNEVIRWNDIVTDGTLGLCFQVDGASGRGCLNSVAAEHKVDTSSNSTSKGKVVEEFVYLEMPAIELMYALYTGSYYSQPGKVLPSGWHLGISGAYINTSSFLNIGNDLWNGSTSGFIVRAAGEKEQDAKKFISEQLAFVASVVPYVKSNGELAIVRCASVLHNEPYIFQLDKTCIYENSPLGWRLNSIRNIFDVRWNYDFLQDKNTRQKILIDQESIDKYKFAGSKTVRLRLIHGSRHSTTVIEGMFDRVRDSLAGPAYELSIRCAPWANHLEVGDMVRVKLPNLADPLRSGGIDRTFQIRRVAIDWLTGEVEFKLFGSSHQSTLITPEDPGQGGIDPSANVIPNSAYTALGTNLASYGGISITPISSVGHITGGSGLVGNDNVDNARYFYSGDLQLDAGVTLPWTKNVQIWVMGHLQINGIFDGSGGGYNGASAISVGTDPNYSSPAITFPATTITLSDTVSHDQNVYQAAGPFYNNGVKGYLGPTMSDGGMDFDNSGNTQGVSSNRGFTTDGAVTSVPNIGISFNSSTNKIEGLPADLQGTSGCSGRVTYHKHWVGGGGYWKYQDIPGGAGGKSGGGIVIIARGISFGGSGKIKTNGLPGLVGESDFSGSESIPANRQDKFYAGSGAGGAPGAAIFILDGLLSDSPSLTNVEAKFGSNPIPARRSSWGGFNQPTEVLSDWFVPYSSIQDNGPTYGYWHVADRDLSGFNGATRTFYVPPTNIPSVDPPKESAAPSAIGLVEFVNSPPSPAANLSSIEVNVTPPSPVGEYSYSKIYYRKTSNGAWIYATSAAPEGVVVVATDGTQYQFQARAVSKSGVESLTGPVATITTTDVINPPTTNNEIPVVVKVPDITGLEISGLGHVADFSGTDVTLVWRRSSFAEWVGPIAAARLGSGALDQYFSHYEIAISDSNTGEELHRATTTTPVFVYTLAMNEDDSKKLDIRKNQTYQGVRRSLGVAVRQYSRQAIRSTNDAYMVIRNPAPSNMTGILVKEGATSAVVTYDRPTDTDFAGVEVFMSLTSGFTPSLANRILNGPDNSLTIYGLTSATNYYLRFRPYDAYGSGNLSSEVGFTTGTIVAADVSGLSAWATQLTPADATFINAQLAADAIDSTKIANLAVGKLTAGVLIATMTIQTNGSINVVNGAYTTKIGVHNVSGTDYAIRTSDGATSTFSVTAAGVLNATGANISGNVTISGGSGYANLTDKPTSLAGINTTEGTKLTGIATGATVGADWATNLSSRPTELTDGRISAGLNSAGALRQIVRGTDLVAGAVATGLNMSSTRIGYYNGSTWPVYIANDGTFYFGSGGAANFIQWNGTTLTINGTLTIQSASGYANLTDRPTSLAGINGTEGTKLTGIEAGATVGATWGVNVGSQPTTLSGINSAEGTKLGGIAAGADVTQTAINATVTITGGGITMSAGGSIKGGKTTPGSGVGFFLGYSGGGYQLDVGNTSAGEYIHFNGTNLILGPKTKLMGASVMEDSDILRLLSKWETTDFTQTLSGNGTATIQGALATSVRLATGSTAAVGTSQIVSSTSAYHLNAGDWTKRRSLLFRIRVEIKVTTTKAWIGLGAKTANLTNSVVFEITQNSIIARSRGSHTTNQSDTTVSTADNYFGNYYTLKIVMDNGSAYFYLNGTLVATHISANGVPTGGNNSQNYMFARLEKTDTVAQTETIDIGELKFLQKE